MLIADDAADVLPSSNDLKEDVARGQIDQGARPSALKSNVSFSHNVNVATTSASVASQSKLLHRQKTPAAPVRLQHPWVKVGHSSIMASLTHSHTSYFDVPSAALWK